MEHSEPLVAPIPSSSSSSSSPSTFSWWIKFFSFRPNSTPLIPEMEKVSIHGKYERIEKGNKMHGLDKGGKKGEEEADEKRTMVPWSAEFVLCSVLGIAPFIYLIWVGIQLSLPTHTVYASIQQYLQPGWFFHYEQDLSDAQFRQFRANIPVLLATLFGYSLFSSGIRKACPSQWLGWIALFSGLLLAVLHGQHTVKLLLCFGINYSIAKLGKGSLWNPTLTWAFQLLLLGWVQLTYGFASWSVGSWFNGFIGWHLTYKFSMLRMISFNMDYYWSHRLSRTAVLHEHTRGCPRFHTTLSSTAFCCARLRAELPHTPDMYTWWPYFVYLAYPPLYLSGPLMTFNAFHSQRQHPLPFAVPWRYGLRWCLNYLGMELFLHGMHVMALTRAPHSTLDSLYTSEWLCLAMYTLYFVWLKLLLIWRFFRIFALLDKIVPPENMLTCVFNNYSVFQFWRDWHASFNLWNRRYLYFPMGGPRTRHFSVWIIFTFIAFWHDPLANLFAWALLICLFLVPELLVTVWWKPIKHPASPYRRLWTVHLAAVGCAVNIVFMVAANLVGFVVGMDGLHVLLRGLSVWTLPLCLTWYYFLVRTMWVCREQKRTLPSRPTTSRTRKDRVQ